MQNKKEKKNKKKSFYFKDYSDSSLFVSSDNTIRASLNRVTFLFFIFLSLTFIFSIKIIYLSLTPERFSLENNKKKFLIKK